MGFLSYNIGFYRDELKKLENDPVTERNIYHARQLMQMLDDLAGEGYTELNERMEKEIHGVSRLRQYLRENHVESFHSAEMCPDTKGFSYSNRKTELNQAIQQAVCEANTLTEKPLLPFAENLHRFCRWIGYDANTAYIFLLRDTLLPFVYYLGRNRNRIYPWLLGRKSFAVLSGQENADDAIRASIYGALEAGCTDYRTFLKFVLPDMRKTIAAYPRAKNALCAMLGSINADRIVVVESGCAGTFPLLLMSLDDRVDMRMYTTYPYLTDIFGARIFTHRYEENRMVETMASQERYLCFAGIRDGQFYVHRCTDAKIRRESLREIKMMLK